MTEYVFLGYEKKEYDNKEGRHVIGYNCYFAFTGNFNGFKPMLKFDRDRQSLSYIYLTEAGFERLGVATLSPLAKIYLTFNQYGSIEAVRQAK